MAKNKNIVSVLAFEKKLVPSDAYMYGTTWEKRKESDAPLKLIEKSDWEFELSKLKVCLTLHANNQSAKTFSLFLF